MARVSAAPESSGPLAAVAEPFTARRALELSARLDAGARTDIARARSLGRQRADAAEALWSSGHAAEGLRLVVAALESAALAATRTASALGAVAKPVPVKPEASETETAAEAETEAGTEGETDAEADTVLAGEAPPVADGTPGLAESLRALGVAPARAAALETTVASVRGATLPALDAEISPSHAELYQRAAEARRAIDRTLGSAGMERREILFARGARIAALVLAVLVLAFVARLALHEPDPEPVVASATWADAPAFGPATVLDGRPDTYWLLPDRTGGWLDVSVSPARRVERVTVVNSHNPPHGDRATRQYRLEIHTESGLARTIEGTFPYTTTPEPVTHEVGVDGVERIRFVAVSHHRSGAGLAELSYE